MSNELSDKELRTNYIIHKLACKKANKKHMSWEQFVLNEVYQD